MHELRTTTGQTVTISYDAATNTVVFRESDWYPDPVRSSAVLKPSADHPKRRRVTMASRAVVWFKAPAALGV